MSLKSSNLKIRYTIFVIIILAAFEHIVIGLFPPLIQYMAKDLKVDIASLGFVSAANILVASISSLYWGYLSRKYQRKKMLIAGTLIWTVSIFLTSFSNSYFQLLIFQIGTGFGLGCIASIGFSVITDYIPYQKRGFILSFWGMAQGMGGISGSILASLTVENNSWKWPFEIVGFIGLFVVFSILFIQNPIRAESELKLKDSYTKNQEAKHIKLFNSNGSNVYLFLQAFLMNIATGSLIWIPTLYIYKIMQHGYSMGTAVIVSGYLYAIFQIGGIASIYFGHLGDKFQRKSFKGRAYLTAFFVFISMPLYILLFNLPMTNLSVSTGKNEFIILVSILEQIFINPWITLMFVISLFASAAQSANTPNWMALLTDVNLPEYRGIAFSIANLFNSLGRAVGNAGVGILLGILSNRFTEPYSYIYTLSILQIFLIPSTLCYLKMSRNNVINIKYVNKILKKRAGKV
ncbi:MFS family permease [Neobacillus niacini]|uniref:MFS transporter n=1 Tax=Neobacillus niacini TaxID=86668 RepID=UPI00278174A0|nr:MFS transporter [Neobacillus niacini]MDQ1003445.1 MFS family permease [Neobacillus niacini]